MSNIAKKLHEEGVALFRKGKLEEALQKLQEALSQASDESRQAAEIYNDTGVIYSRLEDYDAAHAALDEAMDRFTTLADKKGEAQTLGNRASVFEAEELFDDAVETYKESAKLFEELGENDLAMYVWQAISRLRMKQGQYIAAIGAYEEGVDNMPEGSFKRKVLKQILKGPGRVLGTGSTVEEDDSEEEEEDSAEE
jgi:tetratricopeptide (TPR) repeat protein